MPRNCAVCAVFPLRADAEGGRKREDVMGAQRQGRVRGVETQQRDATICVVVLRVLQCLNRA